MPFKSRRQARWMFANKPRMAKKWAKEDKSKHPVSSKPERAKKK